jgi:hypothetical protein
MAGIFLRIEYLDRVTLISKIQFNLKFKEVATAGFDAESVFAAL